MRGSFSYKTNARSLILVACDGRECLIYVRVSSIYPLNYVRDRDKTESLGTLGLETETRPRLSSLSAVKLSAVKLSFSKSPIAGKKIAFQPKRALLYL